MICKVGFGDGHMHIVLFFGRKIERTSCTFKHSRNIFYLLERFSNVNTLGMRGRTVAGGGGGSIGDRLFHL